MKKEAKGKKTGKESDKEPKHPTAYYVKVSSINDIARNVSTFGENVRPLYAFKEKGSYWIVSPAIKLGDYRMVLYAEANQCKSFLVYKPATTAEKEYAVFKDMISAAMPGQDVQNIPVIEFKRNPFETAKKAPHVMNVEVRDYSAVIKGVISRSLENGMIGKVYFFKDKSEYFVGSFSVLEEEEDTRIFCYAKLSAPNGGGFFRYNYNTDKVEITDTFGEHSYIYVRIINLADAPSFFKPN